MTDSLRLNVICKDNETLRISLITRCNNILTQHRQLSPSWSELSKRSFDSCITSLYSSVSLKTLLVSSSQITPRLGSTSAITVHFLCKRTLTRREMTWTCPQPWRTSSSLFATSVPALSRRSPPIKYQLVQVTVSLRSCTWDSGIAIQKQCSQSVGYSPK